MNLQKLSLRGNSLTEIHTPIWTVQLDYQEVNLRYNLFTCTCRVINDIQQLRYKCKNGQLITYFKCDINTIVCEDIKNFAIGLSASSSKVSKLT